MSDSANGQNGGGKGQGGGNGPPEKKSYHIKVDRSEFEVEQQSLTGAQIRQLPSPSIGPDRDLFEVVPGGSDKKVADDEVVPMRNGLRFFTAPAQINPG